MIIVHPYDQRQGRKTSASNPDDYYEFIKKRMYQTVEAEFDTNGALSNADEIVPHTLKIFPEHLTVYTEEVELRQYIALNQEAIRPSEASFFIYAFNANGKLIQPWCDKPNESSSTVICPYEIDAFTQYFDSKRFKIENEASEMPILVGHELAYAGEYNRSVPKVNPPHAMMVRGISAGRFSLCFHARLSSAIHMPEKQAQKKDVSASVTVDIIEGFEKVNALALFSSVDNRLKAGNPDGREAGVGVKVGESIELSAVGIKFMVGWDGQKYVPLAPKQVTMKELGWTFEPVDNVAANSFLLQSVNASGSAVKLTGLKASEKQVGRLRIYGMGKVWILTVRVNA